MPPRSGGRSAGTTQDDRPGQVLSARPGLGRPRAGADLAGGGATRRRARGTGRRLRALSATAFREENARDGTAEREGPEPRRGAKQAVSRGVWLEPLPSMGARRHQAGAVSRRTGAESTGPRTSRKGRGSAERDQARPPPARGAGQRRERGGPSDP